LKLLLINPPQNHTISGNLPTYVDEARGNIPPLGLLYTASAVLKETDWEVNICDMSAGHWLEEFHKPDLVGITATTFTLIDVLETAKKVKQYWNVPIVLGGIHPTIYPDETSRLPNIDTVFTGESEVTFPKMIDYIAKGAVRVVEGETTEVEKLPLPARQLLKQKDYYSVIGDNKYLTSMFTSRGCPYQCIFCHRKTMGRIFRARTAQQVIDEMFLIRTSGIKEILIYDDTFTVNKQRVIDICREIERREIDIIFDIRARVDHIDSEIIFWLKQAGCKRIHYGVEASNDRVLQLLQKGITIEQVTTAFELTKKAGIETLAYFIIGSPTESYSEIEQTISFAKELDPDYCHFSIMTPYPATKLYTDRVESGECKDYWREFAANPTEDFQTPYLDGISREGIEELLGKAYRKFYWQPKKIAKEFMRTKSIKQLAKKGSSAVKMLVRR